jgi:hypothetical protein
LLRLQLGCQAEPKAIPRDGTIIFGALIGKLDV